MKPGASQEEIVGNFLKLAKKYHPDSKKSDDAKKRYTEIKEAYQTLSKEENRLEYDATGKTVNEEQPNPKKPFFADPDYHSEHAHQTYEDYFKEYEQFFTFDLELLEKENMKMQEKTRKLQPDIYKQRIKGSSVTIETEVSFMEAVAGTSKTLRAKREVICDKCEGKKVQPVDSNKNDCLTCYGTGDNF